MLDVLNQLRSLRINMDICAGRRMQFSSRMLLDFCLLKKVLVHLVET